MTKKKTKRGVKMTTRLAELHQTVEYDLGTITTALLIAAADPMNDLQLIRRAMLTVIDQCDQTKKMIDADLNRHLSPKAKRVRR